MSFNEADVQSALRNLIDPNTRKDFVSGKSVKNIKISGNDLSLDIVLGYPALSVWGEIRAMVEAHLKAAFPDSSSVRVKVTIQVVPHAVQRGAKLVDGVKNIIAVASGKGGVGKSTTAVNIALALAAEGARVGMLDADIYGPSQPTMLGISGQPESVDGKSMEPMINHGLQAMSIGFLIDNDDTLGQAGLSDCGFAARHRRHPAVTGPASAGHRRRDRDHPAGHCADGCAQGSQDVREGRHQDRGHCGKHEHAHLLQMRTRRTHLRRGRRRKDVRGLQYRASRKPAAGYPHSRADRFRQADGSGRSRRQHRQGLQTDCTPDRGPGCGNGAGSQRCLPENCRAKYLIYPAGSPGEPGEPRWFAQCQ